MTLFYDLKKNNVTVNRRVTLMNIVQIKDHYIHTFYSTLYKIGTNFTIQFEIIIHTHIFEVFSDTFRDTVGKIN